MRRDRGAHGTEPVLPDPEPHPPTDDVSPVPVFAVREWASRLYEQERLKRDAAWWRLAWPFGVALVLAAGAGEVARIWQLRESDVALGGAVVLGAAAVGVTVGGLLRWRAVLRRQAVASARPATVESLPAAARAVVLESPRLRFRSPSDGPSFAALRDEVAAAAPLGEFAAAVLVWAVVMRGRVDGTLEDWVRGRRP
ncbi:hypothetical protein GCM10009868_40030 [Terrabacter aerolatus]|uniref:Uncharacterized protein n=1 Tax=Terrabacter aerolatus TaxID=422442 RepID=A0A512D068_9MICO|nr:hypothetical protein [Terrabacter aerolatus]GEO29864.1 hypothetical protein TAE01_16740 [Terrabacter aerolatus]